MVIVRVLFYFDSAIVAQIENKNIGLQLLDFSAGGALEAKGRSNTFVSLLTLLRNGKEAAVRDFYHIISEVANNCDDIESIKQKVRKSAAAIKLMAQTNFNVSNSFRSQLKADDIIKPNDTFLHLDPLPELKGRIKSNKAYGCPIIAIPEFMYNFWNWLLENQSDEMIQYLIDNKNRDIPL